MSQYVIFYVLLRNKWLILTGLLVGLVAAGVLDIVKPASYRSDARLLVRYVSDTVPVDPQMSGEQVVTPGRPSETLINTEVDILTSAELFATVAKELAAEAAAKTNAPETPSARYLARNFHVASGNNSSTLHVYLDGPAPDVAQRALSKLIDAYLLKHQEVHRDPGAFEFIARQTDEMRTRLNDTEDELRRVRNQAGIVSMVESRKMVMERVQDLDRSIRETESALASTRARLESITAQMPRAQGGAPAMDTNGVAATERPRRDLQDAVDRLTELYQRESTLLAIYTSNSVPVRSIRRQIDDLKQAVGTGDGSGGSSNQPPARAQLGRANSDALLTDLASYRAEDAALVARLEVLHKQMDVANSDLQRMEASEVQLSRLERTREVYDTNYRYFSQRQEQARIDNAMENGKVSNIALVQPPTLAEVPLRTELMRLLFMVLAVCTGGGVALALAREYVFDHSIRHPFEIPRLLRLPLLAVLPRLGKAPAEGADSPKAIEARRKAARRVDSACEVVAQLIREQVSQKTDTLLVGFSAAHGGAGVTTVAERIANALQLSGLQKVLLATVQEDGQFVGKFCGDLTPSAEPPPEPPADKKKAKAPPAAEEPPVVEERLPVRIAFSEKRAITPSIFAEMNRRDYDCVLFDLPPLTESEVPVRMLPRLHGVVLVLESARTRRSEALGCVTQLEQLRCTIYGAVLNKFETPVPAWVTPPAANATAALVPVS